MTVWLHDLPTDLLMAIFDKRSPLERLPLRLLDKTCAHLLAPLVRAHLALSEEQYAAFRVVARSARRNDNVFITGKPGTGKTHLVRALATRLRNTVVCASTGCAAENISAAGIAASTLHSLLGLGTSPKAVVRAMRAYARRWKQTPVWILEAKVLIIDEVSIFSAEFLDEVVALVLYLNPNLTLVFVGDPLQLGTPSDGAPFFESDTIQDRHTHWVLLAKPHRQDAEGRFLQVLDRMRCGYAQHGDVEWINAHCKQTFDDTATTLFPTNRKVRDYNDLKQTELQDRVQGAGECLLWEAFDEGDTYLLDRQTRAPYTLDLYVGTRVMCIANLPESGLVNGSIGDVTAIRHNAAESFVTVQFRDRRTTFSTLELKRFDVEDEHGECLGTRSTLPLDVAFALTAHKAQGLTLDKANISMHGVFAPAQAYVALSRVRRVEDAHVIGLTTTTANKVDAKAVDFWRRVEAVMSMRTAEAPPPPPPPPQRLPPPHGLFDDGDAAFEEALVRCVDLQTSPFAVAARRAGFGDFAEVQVVW